MSSSSFSWVKSEPKEKFDSEALFDRGNKKDSVVTSNMKPRDRFEEEQKWERMRLERKKFHKRNDFIEEELVPKPVGREAMIEKKKQRSSYTKMEKETDHNYSDDFLMGDSTSEYQQMLQRSRAKNAYQVERQQQNQVKRQELAEKYRAKEEALLQSFRAVVDQGDIPLLKHSQSNKDN